ncbi:MAG: flagellar biosynthesis anti-sigma factor FlgM [Acidobacteria bacterium]|jgi:flagellar biosynthesis anti-sigma factor FlgM|nr:MAG: flagellar biosynthesis anti-sigma factor FlgM [Acidobacteriota bacterium]
MIDRVNISNQGIDRPQATQGNELVRNPGKDRQVSSGSDSVALSSKAKEMDQLSGTIEESRTERFNKVQRALESGTYHVSARDIARKLIDANQK